MGAPQHNRVTGTQLGLPVGYASSKAGAADAAVWGSLPWTGPCWREPCVGNEQAVLRAGGAGGSARGRWGIMSTEPAVWEIPAQWERGFILWLCEHQMGEDTSCARNEAASPACCCKAGWKCSASGHVNTSYLSNCHPKTPGQEGREGCKVVTDGCVQMYWHLLSTVTGFTQPNPGKWNLNAFPCRSA